MSDLIARLDKNPQGEHAQDRTENRRKNQYAQERRRYWLRSLRFFLIHPGMSTGTTQGEWVSLTVEFFNNPVDDPEKTLTFLARSWRTNADPQYASDLVLETATRLAGKRYVMSCINEPKVACVEDPDVFGTPSGRGNGWECWLMTPPKRSPIASLSSLVLYAASLVEPELGLGLAFC